MKIKFCVTFVLLVMSLVAVCSFGVSAATEGYLTYSVSGGEAEITDCSSSAAGELIIPDTLGGYPVTSIGGYAFRYCTGLTSVMIPDSVTSIGDNAFYGCTGLTSVTIPNSVTSIGDSAFSGCTGLTSVTIPDSVTSIVGSAFYGCTGLTRVNITNVAAWCAIDFGNGTSNPLYYAKNLYLNGNLVTDLVIPDGVTSIGKYVFYNCTSLASVMIPNSVTSIGIYAFYRCIGLTSVIIPNSVTSIGAWAFDGCTGLTSVMIPDSVTSIGNDAFSGCTGLTSVTIPDSVTSIGYSAFSSCTGLTSVTIPNSVTSIGGSTFSGCTGLTSVTIPDSVTSIGIYAFSGCTDLARVNITDVAAWCAIDFGNDWSNPLRYAKKLYLNGNLVTDLVIPDGVTSIGNFAFYGCTRLTSVTIPDSVTSIGSSAFDGCIGLTSVTIPDSITSIGDDAFRGCTSLTSVTVGKGIELIPEYAFYNCSKLKAVCLPSSVKYIRNDAFNGCSAIETVFYGGSEEDWANVLTYNRNENLTNAKIIYNAVTKTYSFVTNCDVALPDVTAYALFTAPTVENGDARLAGWYDNADFAGDAITFPYYGNTTTLYALWATRKGTSFDDAIVAKANRQYTVTTETSGQLVYFEFVPQYTKEYRFYTTGSVDTYGYLYNSSKSQLKTNDDDGNGNNFYIAYTLTAGNKYYIAAKCYSGTGTFTFVTEEPVDYTINSITLMDMSGKAIDTIPSGTFLATVSFTNVSSSQDTVIVLAQYTASGVFKGTMYVNTEDVPVGATIKITLPVDNSSGEIAKLKAFCWQSFSNPAPMGNSVTFPAA